MGLRMDNMHTPSVPSGPTTSQDSSKIADQDKPSLMDLMDEKQRVESELSGLSSVLDTHAVNMNTSLTTFDGYPRDDLDVAQIRTTRARIIRLQNDYKGLMSKIENGLHEHHASMQSPSSQPSSTPYPERPTASSTSATNSDSYEIPFAKVTDVAHKSPAEDAGLQLGDKIRRFGTVNWMNHERLSKVSETVQRNEGRSISVELVRQQTCNSQPDDLVLQLIPRRDWGGRGMLGCHLVPI